MKIKNILLSVSVSLMMVSNVFAGVVSPLPKFTADDSILVIAPHPDDEAIGTGGVIQAALKAGAKVKVVLMTNGENNELSFIVYKKRLVLQPKEILAMGEIRRQETITAMMSFGLNKNDIVSFGYPDFGTMEILTKCWGDAKPFRSMLSRVRKVPFDNARSFGAPYTGESVLKDIERVLLDFKPTKVFVSHPADTNRDHRAAYLFLRVALWDLDGKIDQPKIYPYVIHVVGWLKPRGYFPDKPIYVPDGLVSSEINWNTLWLDQNTVQKKRAAIDQYVSQIKYAPKYLITFARNNELFGDYPMVPIVRQMSSDVVWQYLGTGDENILSEKNGLAPGKNGKQDHISSLAYARRGSEFLVKISLKKSIDQQMGISIFLLGYKMGVPFGEMPKLNLLSGFDGFHIKDGRKNVASQEVQVISKDKEIVFILPLSMLGNPDYLLSSAKTTLYDLTLDETAWRILSLK